MEQQLSPSTTTVPQASRTKPPVTTHILDIAQGRPASGVIVTLLKCDEDRTWTTLGTGATDSDGRCMTLLDVAHELTPGHYKLTFSTGAYLEVRSIPSHLHIIIAILPCCAVYSFLGCFLQTSAPTLVSHRIEEKVDGELMYAPSSSVLCVSRIRVRVISLPPPAFRSISARLLHTPHSARRDRQPSTLRQRCPSTFCRASSTSTSTSRSSSRPSASARIAALKFARRLLGRKEEWNGVLSCQCHRRLIFSFITYSPHAHTRARAHAQPPPFSFTIV